jgi:2-phosphosulfolactate phosphatase
MQERRVNVYHLPAQVDPTELAGSVVVVIDLLRASTTICQALASGAREVVPFLEVEETLAAAAKSSRCEVVLGGERSGGKINGFDLGNSPSEYTPEAVAGKRVFITTTNGTRALHHAHLGSRVLVAAFVNLAAIAQSVKDEPRVDILCAGTGGEATREDILAAGALVDYLTQLRSDGFEKNTTAEHAVHEWQKVLNAAAATGQRISDQLAIELRDTTGGRNLLAIGLDQDLVDCAQVDRLGIVPKLDVREWRIHTT